MLGLMLVLSGLVGPAGALTPGPTVVVQCGGCSRPLTLWTIGSGNTIGARFWTDGKVEAPMLPMRPELGKCPHCQKVFWIADAKRLGEIQPWATEKQWETAKEIGEPGEQDYLKAAGVAGLSRARVVSARQRAWWLANDPVRARPGRAPTWNAAQRTNLEVLSALLDETKARDVVLKAEIARELGRFDVCAKLLTRTFSEKEGAIAAHAALVRRLAAEKKTAVELRP